MPLWNSPLKVVHPLGYVHPDFRRTNGGWETGEARRYRKATVLYGEVTPKTLDACTRGNGMIVPWKRGKGEIFTAATCEWIMGLTRRDSQVEKIAGNVLDRFGKA